MLKRNPAVQKMDWRLCGCPDFPMLLCETILSSWAWSSFFVILEVHWAVFPALLNWLLVIKPYCCILFLSFAKKAMKAIHYVDYTIFIFTKYILWRKCNASITKLL